MSLTITGTIRYYSQRTSQSPHAIHVYLSSHLATEHYPYYRINIHPKNNNGGGDMSFVIQTTLKQGVTIIPAATMLCFSVVKPFDSRSNKDTDATDDDSDDPHVGSYDLGCSDMYLKGLFALNNYLKSTKHSMFEFDNPQDLCFDVIDRFDTNVKPITNGRIKLVDINVIVKDCSFGIIPPAANDITTLQQPIKNSPKSMNPLHWKDYIKPVFPNNIPAINMANRSLALFKGKYSVPTFDVLEMIHCPYYQEARCFNVGCAYPLKVQVEPSDENFYANAIRTILSRYHVSEQWYVRVIAQQMYNVPNDKEDVVPGFSLACMLSGMAVCLFAVSCYYTHDETEIPNDDDDDVDPRKKTYAKISSDRFTCLRFNETDDCEGTAEEIMLEIMDLVKYQSTNHWKSSIVKALALCLGCYIPMMVHGAVNASSASEYRSMVENKSFQSSTSTSSAKSKYYSPSNVDPSALYGEAPQWSSPDNVTNGFYSYKNNNINTRAKTIEKMRKVAKVHEPECHVFVVAEPTFTFLQSLKKTEQGLVAANQCELSPSLINPALWTKHLPRLVLDGTGSVSPIQMPLGLLYEPNSKERSSMIQWHEDQNKARKMLETRHPLLADEITLVLPRDYSCTIESVEKSMTSTPEFYWSNVAAYVPTACVHEIAINDNNNITSKSKSKPSNKKVFREIAYVNPSTNTYGSIIQDVIYDKGDAVGFVPTLIWNEAESAMVDERILLDVPIPPMKFITDKDDNDTTNTNISSTINTRIHDLEIELKSHLISNARFHSTSPGIRELINLKVENVRINNNTIPFGSAFHHSSKDPITIIYQYRLEKINKAMKVLSKVVSDPHLMIIDVQLHVRKIGKSLPMTYTMYDIDVAITMIV